MAYITDKKNIFFVTSPRSPFKMQSEIGLLISEFAGKKWDKDSQTKFAQSLSDSDFFEGEIKNNLDFAARDRINRAPKALGLVKLTPVISLTKAGEQFLNGKRPEEILLRQLLKFQLPSPYHIDKNNDFNIKPYLELIRLVKELNGLSKDEIAIFVMQLKNINEYEGVKKKILEFRQEVKNIDRQKTSYKRFSNEVYIKELKALYDKEIESGKTSIRQTDEITLEKFIKTKEANFRDYADAAIRYLRATQLLTFDYKSNKLLPIKYKLSDIDFILNNINRSATEFSSEEDFQEFLGNDLTPKLLPDNSESLIKELISFGLNENEISKLRELSINDIKDRRDQLLLEKQEINVTNEIEKLQTYDEYHEIVTTFDQISRKQIVDPSLIFEWNVWRAFTMLDDGSIKGNFKIDIEGIPLTSAPGNKPDIECQYKNYNIIVEVTLSTGQKQYEMEGEPVARHLGKYSKETNQETFCIFIAQEISNATLAHYFTLNKVDISYYGGKSKIVPLNITDFLKILQKAYTSKVKPNSNDFYKFVVDGCNLVDKVKDEIEWYSGINQLIENWI